MEWNCLYLNMFDPKVAILYGSSNTCDDIIYEIFHVAYTNI